MNLFICVCVCIMSWRLRIGVFKGVNLVGISELLLDVCLTLGSLKKKIIY